MVEDITVWYFRQDKTEDNRKIFDKEIEKGRLRQGWGYEQTKLDVSENDWVKRVIKSKNPLSSGGKVALGKIYGKLIHMTEIEPGDIIAILDCPKKDQFTITKAVERNGKVYDFNTTGLGGVDDFKHVIYIDPSNNVVEDTSVLNRDVSKFNSSYQSPLKRIAKYKDKILKLYDKENKSMCVQFDIRSLERKKQIILYGPPGTGKTFATKSIAYRLLKV